MIKKFFHYFICIAIFLWTCVAYGSLIIPIYFTDGCGKALGTIKADDTIYGLLLTPHLKDIPPGVHGFHLHTGSSCGRNGLLAGGHFDPVQTEQHKGPYRGNGHLGDLPVLIADARGKVTLPVLAPRLKLETIRGRTLVIMAGGDNYADFPKKMGGGGARLACGEIPYH